MKKIKFENYLDKLALTKECMDRAEMEKYIADTTGYSRNLLDRQILDVKALIKMRYERFGIITEEDNVETLKSGYNILCKLGVTLEDVRKMILNWGFEKESPMGIRIQQDWNYAVLLLNDYLNIENSNLLSYVELLEEAQNRIKNNPMYSTCTDKQLKAVYSYLCDNNFFCSLKEDYNSFCKIFRACSLDVTERIKLNTIKYGSRAALRVIVEVLAGKFYASLVNRYFCDYLGEDLNLASHNRATSYDDLRDKLKSILQDNA